MDTSRHCLTFPARSRWGSVSVLGFALMLVLVFALVGCESQPEPDPSPAPPNTGTPRAHAAPADDGTMKPTRVKKLSTNADVAARQAVGCLYAWDTQKDREPTDAYMRCASILSKRLSEEIAQADVADPASPYSLDWVSLSEKGAQVSLIEVSVDESVDDGFGDAEPTATEQNRTVDVRLTLETDSGEPESMQFRMTMELSRKKKSDPWIVDWLSDESEVVNIA